MNHPFRRFAAAGLGVFLYIVLFPVLARPELTVEPLWATNPASAPVSPAATAPYIPVEFERGFAYLGTDGQLAYRGRTAYGVSLSPEYFINYPRNPQQLVVQYSDGSFAESIPVSGYPFVRHGRIFLLAEEGGRLVEWRDGAPALDIGLPAPLLDLDASDRLIAAAPAAGGVMLLDAGSDQPVPYEVARPTASGTEIIRAVSLAEDGSRLAVIASGESPSGGRQGTVTVYTVEAGRARPVVRRVVADSSVPRPLVQLSADGSRIIYHASDEIVVLEPETGTEYRVAVADRPVATVELRDGEAPGTLVLARSDTRDPARGFARSVRLLLLTEGGRVPLDVGWYAEDASLAAADGLLVLRVDERYLGFEAVIR
jgi:hypothetical protein